jgi:starvation-inducible outer membrane lipoprotein
MTDQVIPSVTTKWKRIATAITSVFAVGAIAVSAYHFIQKHQPALEELKKTAVSVPYDELVRNQQDYIGQIVRFRGKVVQVVPGEQNGKYVILIIWVGKGLTSLNDVVYVEYQPDVHDPRIMKNDVVQFSGKFNGIRSPEANRANAEVPQVVAYEVERIE